MANKTNDCWVWPGAPSSGGYGRKKHNGKNEYVHRLSYMYFIGPIPEGLAIDHLCRNRMCYNPAHLEVVTLVENVLRGESFGATFHNATACVNGHQFDEENTRLFVREGKQRRACRACSRTNTRAYRARQAVAQ
jgi:hypothetical protein